MSEGFWLLLVAATWGGGCSGSAMTGVAREAELRKQVPVAVCSSALPAIKVRDAQPVSRSLDAAGWARVLVPLLGGDQLGVDAVDCTGHSLFANEALRGGRSTRGWPRPILPDDLVLSAGPDGLRVVWLRTLHFDNGDEGGPVALVRAFGDHAEVYGIGDYRGPGASLASVAFAGSEPVLRVESSRCLRDDVCRTQAHFFLLRTGRFVAAATIDLARTEVVASATEPGLRARYVLSTDVDVRSTGIHLLEQIRVRIVPVTGVDRDGDRELRVVEFARDLRVESDALRSSEDPLWNRVVGED